MTISVWILGDQLTVNHPALEAALHHGKQSDIRVLMIESESRVHRMHYAAKKLILLFSAMRHYAESLRLDGYELDYRIAQDMKAALKAHVEAHQPSLLIVMAASSYGGLAFQESLENILQFPVKIIPNALFLSRQYDPFPGIDKGESIRQEQFYRRMRRHFNLLMDEDGKPTGGQWNYDKKNRAPFDGEVEIPGLVSFEPDEITLEVIDEVLEKFPWTQKPEKFDLAVTHQEAQEAADDFFEHRLKYFGTYEDAMTQADDVLFHSMLSPYLNLGLLDPLALAQRAQAMYQDGSVSLNNAEGFIRQVIGWREYMHWQYWRLMPDLADVNYFDVHQVLPEFFWTGETEMNCLKHALGRSLEDGYLHHIERLMLISNYCLLAGVAPQAVLKWFQSLFIDAYDWVMLPNVLGMSMYADGGMIGTKPYVASANYINKMSDYCQGCPYDHKLRTGEDACPFNFLYWNFLLQHEELLRENPRMARMLYNLEYLDGEERDAVKESTKIFLRL
ncbi:MAG TPA: cryptochrome/photolyase family protein [Brevefilum sp.]